VKRERSAAAAMLGMSGFVVLAVSEREGELEQAVETTADLVGCPSCGAVAELHDRRPSWVRDLPTGGRALSTCWVSSVVACMRAVLRSPRCLGHAAVGRPTTSFQVAKRAVISCR
jgi:hypothetical protein